MKRIEFIGNDMIGMINVNIGLAAELTRRGENVTYYTGTRFKRHVHLHGVAHEEMPSPTNNLPLHTITVCLSSLRQSIASLPAMLQRFRENRPDCIVTTWDGFTGMFLAEILDVPLLMVAPFPTTKNFLMEFWRDNSIDQLRKVLTNKRLSHLEDEYYQIATSLHEDYKLQLPRYLEDCVWGNALVESRGRRSNLIVNSRFFLGDLVSDASSDNIYVGSLHREEASTTIPTRSDLDSRPLVFVSLGTLYGQNQAFFNMCAEALGEMAIRVIYSLGNAELDTQSTPNNFRVESFVSQLDVLRTANVFVSHGGVSSVHESLRAGVPTILCPQGYDQFITSRRMVACDAAIIMKDDTLNPECLRTMVESILHGSETHRGLPELALRDQEAGGLDKACDVILELCDTCC